MPETRPNGSMEAHPFGREEVVLAAGCDLPVIGHDGGGPASREPARSKPVECAGDLGFGERSQPGVAGERNAEEKIVATCAPQKIRRAGVPGDVFVGHEAGTHAIGRNEHVVADLRLGPKHVRDGVGPRHAAMVKTHAELFVRRMRGRCGVVGRWIRRLGELHGWRRSDAARYAQMLRQATVISDMSMPMRTVASPVMMGSTHLRAQLRRSE